MRSKDSKENNNVPCSNGSYSVQVYSRRAALINEFCLDAKENNLPDLASAEEHLRTTMTPLDFASTVSLARVDASNDETIVQFDLERI